MKTSYVPVLIGLAAVAIAFGSTVRAAEPVDLVDPFIGTMGDGNTLPGPTLPWGFVQPGPDTLPNSGAGGYKFDRAINGFSQQHIGGMGGPIYGEISLFPYAGDPVGDPSKIIATGKSNESTTPGYYAVTLAPWNVKIELTATRYVSFQRQTFPANAGVARVLIDVGHCLYASAPATNPARGPGWNSAFPVGGEVHVDVAAREVSGFMVYKGGRTATLPWKVYFVTRFDAPITSVGTWDDDRHVRDGRDDATGSALGASLTFDAAGKSVLSRTSVSWRSVDLARAHLAEEATTEFDAARTRCRATWASTLARLTVDGGSASDLTRFYTALYRAHLAPNDWTGESPERFGDRVYYENQLCMWDTFRTVIPLLELLQPTVASGIVNSIVNVQQVDGWTGDAHSAHQYEHVQNGSNADVIVADAYAKRLPGIDWKAAYEAIRKNAFVDNDPTTNRRPKLGRFHLDDYRKYHYVPTDASDYKDTQAVTRTLEYVYDDFCVWTLAKAFGTAEDAADLRSRLGWYKESWDASVGGYMRGRLRSGAWHEPFSLTEKLTGKQYYEGLASTWSWYVPHDVAGLIELYGGDDAFIARLTDTCEHYYEAYNEPCMLEAYLFIHAGRPDLAQRYVRVALKNFTVEKNGLPGNDDSGTTSAWVVWTMLGLYPNAGQPFYYIGSPTFRAATLELAGDKTFTIRAPETSAANVYVQSATLNGKPLDRAWLTHDEIAAGGELMLAMGDKPSTWGQTRERPPSLTPPR